ncbi:MAG: amidohydrolase family protein [Umezawaea sp.]
MTGLLIRGAEVAGCAGVDVRVRGERVSEVAPGLHRAAGESVLEARGGALLPGLHDAHLHLAALAAAGTSVRCGPPDVRDAGELAAALGAGAADAHGWVRGVGYVETVAGELDSAAVDRWHASRPVRIQHRSGALWIVNSAAAQHLGLADGVHPGIERAADGTPTGRLWRADDWLRSRLPPPPAPDLAAVGAHLAALGITAVTDATPDLDDDALAFLGHAVDRGDIPQRVQLLGVPLDRREPGPRLAVGPYKIVLADSGLPDLDSLVGRIRTVHAVGRSVAVHCVSREALVLLVAGLRSSGARRGDRIEHASLVPAELLRELAVSGLRVVTQPGFLADRGDDYLADVPAPDHGDLYRCRSLLDAGIPVALSSDAPYGPLDPWAVVAAAMHRRTPTGAVAGTAERVSFDEALGAYLSAHGDPGGEPRRVVPGLAADLVLLDRPLADMAAEPAAGAVRTVLIGGSVVTDR